LLTRYAIAALIPMFSYSAKQVLCFLIPPKNATGKSNVFLFGIEFFMHSSRTA
jgi:hypothetical protein